MENEAVAVGQVRMERMCASMGAGVVQVTLSNPAKRNAMSCRMWRELREVFQALQQDRQVRCVLLQGAGGQFCAGGDIAEYPAFRFDETSLRRFHEEDVWGGLSALLACDVPTIASIEGACMGAGVEIASACDLRIASSSARFGAPIAKLGFPMAPRELALVRSVAGDVSTRQMLLEASTLDAATLLARGFLTRMHPDAQALAQDTQQTAQRIAALAPAAARMNKQALRVLAHGALPQDMLANAYDYANSAEHREGVSAFIEKRPPVF